MITNGVKQEGKQPLAELAEVFMWRAHPLCMVLFLEEHACLCLFALPLMLM